MDGQDAAFDNMFTDRLWRSVKYDEAYLREYFDGRDALTMHGDTSTDDRMSPSIPAQMGAYSGQLKAIFLKHCLLGVPAILKKQFTSRTLTD